MSGKPEKPLRYSDATVADMVDCLRQWRKPSPDKWTTHGKWKFCQALIEEFDKRGTLSAKQSKVLRDYWTIYWYRPAQEQYYEQLRQWEAAQ